VNAAAEGEHGWWVVTGDHEVVRTDVDGGVTVGGGGVSADERAGRDDDTDEFDSSIALRVAVKMTGE